MKILTATQTQSFQQERLGTIVIVDISGYSHFVQQVDAATGVQVISKLLSTVIQANKLGFSVSEIEGDAVLFYRYGTTVRAAAIRNQFELMLTAFEQEVKRLSIQVPEAGSLSIKLVATHGKLISFSLGGFKKLYGEAVIKAHRLLKNHINSKTYVLIAEELLSRQEIEACETADIFKMCEEYDLGSVCYRYLAYGKHKHKRTYEMSQLA